MDETKRCFIQLASIVEDKYEVDTKKVKFRLLQVCLLLAR
jgi:hypothetical protein